MSVLVERRSDCCLVVALAALVAGCAPENIDRTYGKRRGAMGGGSVNGTAVLAGMFEEAGHRVMTWRRLSPRLEDCDVIVWAPDDFQPPTQEQREFLEEWLWGQSGRTLVYIGRDYDASISYWKKILPDVPPEQVLEVSRRLATAQAEHDAGRAQIPKRVHCDWFTLQSDGSHRQADRLQGPWSEGLDASRAEIEIGACLAIPNQQETDDWFARDDYLWADRPEFEALLRSDEETLVSRVTLDLWEDSQILLVSNGSFLLNLPLVNHEHRKLAGKIVSACGPPGKVMFLESGPGGPMVLDEEPDANAPTGFEIFTVWPVGVIALHLTVLGITVCFAMFPIFGRARHIDEGTTSDFGKHVEALGELLELTRDRQYAVHQVQHYHEHVSSTRKA